MPNLLLTGCAGFIGFNFLKILALRGHLLKKYTSVISIDNMGYAARFNREAYYKLCDSLDIKTIDKNINDLQDRETVAFFKTLPSEPWDIVDFASSSHVDNSIKAPSEIFRENSVIPASIIDWITQNDYKNISKINKFIHITTDETLGQLALDTPESGWFDENTAMCPQNPYSASKVAQDVFLRSIQHTFGLKLKFIRLSNQFGPYQHTEKMLPATILRALNGESIKIYGEGKNIRQWCPVTRSVKIISDVLYDELSPIAFKNDIIQLATKDKLLNNNEVVAIWSKILEEKHGIKTSILYVPDRLGHDLMYALKTNDIIAEYYKTPLIEEFESTIKHYIENKEYYN